VRVARAALGGADAGDFRVNGDRCTGRSLPPGGRCVLALLFTPRDAGPRRATLDVTLAGPGGVRTASLDGTGLRRYAARDDAPPGPCYADAYQVGRSAYGYVGGLRAISVKQYWSPSCRAAMAYVWIWKQYRDKAALGGGTWTVDLVASGDRAGARRQEKAVGQPFELWTEPLRAAGGCAVATATLAGAGSASATVTSRCSRPVRCGWCRSRPTC
jgi:hypothetical protein